MLSLPDLPISHRRFYPRINLTRFHGVFAPNSHHRAGIVNRQADTKLPVEVAQTESEKHGAKTWAMRLKRAFDIDIKTCESCGGCVRVIACVDNPDAIDKILTHLQAHKSLQMKPLSRSPPAVSQI